jgi:hypothetical protein
MKHTLAAMCSLQLALVVNLYAHHGKNYLVTGGFETPNAGSWHALFDSDFRNRFGMQSYEIEPGILYGVTDRLEVELHAHNVIVDGAFHTEAIAVESRLGLFGHSPGSDQENEERQGRIGMALLLEFEKGLSDQPDAYEARAILGAERGNYQLAGNLIWQHAFDEERSHEIRYALGVKRTLSASLGIGVELDGGFDKLSAARFTPGVFISAGEQLDLKLGASLRMGSLSDDSIIRLALVYGVK